MTIRIFDAAAPNRSTAIFEGSNSGLLNWDDVANKEVRSLWDEMCSQFWRPEEVTLAQDQAQWHSIMTPAERETYRLAVGQLAVLDSLATRYDLALSQYISDSSVTAAYSFVAAMESIHNYSYTYILSSFTSEAEKRGVFENAKTNEYMLRRNTPIFEVYEQFINNPTVLTAIKSLVANLILEGLYFTSGFTYFYHLARMGKMIGTQTIISMIRKD